MNVVDLRDCRIFQGGGDVEGNLTHELLLPKTPLLLDSAVLASRGKTEPSHFRHQDKQDKARQDETR